MSYNRETNIDPNTKIQNTEIKFRINFKLYTHSNFNIK